jgi:hypothetical protein
MLDARHDEFVPLQEVLETLAVSRATLRKHLGLAGVSLYLDPVDHRRRWIRREDASRLLIPQPAQRLPRESEAIAA